MAVKSTPVLNPHNRWLALTFIIHKIKYPEMLGHYRTDLKGDPTSERLDCVEVKLGSLAFTIGEYLLQLSLINEK